MALNVGARALTFVGGSTTIPNVDNTVSRTAIALSKLPHGGKLTRVVVDITAVGGTQPASVDIEILNTQNLTATLNRINTIYRNLAVAITSPPEQILDDQLTIPIDFVIVGTDGNIQIVLTQNGADGTTDFTYEIAVLGEELG